MLLEEFSVIFDRPEKIKKLREYILRLAVRGKLVEQDEDDEPASVLLEKIGKEKDRLVNEKKIKKEKLLPKIAENEIPYELPNGWKWARLGNLGITQTGTTPSTKNPEYFGGNIPFIKPADISENGIVYNNESLTELGLEKGRLINSNSVLMVCIGGSIGKNYFIDRDCSCNQQINAITGLCGINNKFLHYFVSSNEFYEQIISTATGSATPIINKSKWEQLLVQVPPLNEQNKIVEKVDYLMAFCDKLEKQLAKKVKYGYLSAKSILNDVSNCSTYEELEETLRFIIDNFKDLTLADGAVDELKNAILSLAVKGKLVPQDENDEPASVLLEKIREEKDRLVKDKKIKKEKSLPEIGKDEIPYELPKGWKWAKLGEIGFSNIGLTYKPSDISTEGVPVLRSMNIQDGKIDYSNLVHVNTHVSEDKICKKGDILICARNGSKRLVGKCAIIEDEGMSFGAFMAIYRSECNDYISRFINSPIFKIQLGGVNTTTINQITQSMLKNIICPIPPKNEQKRIVDKVDTLFKICDELQLMIEKSKKYSEKLMESILKDSFKA